MPDPTQDDFERRLERMFAQAPEFPDAVLFAARVRGRLDRDQSVRRAVLALAGGAGAAVTAAHLLSANVGERLAALSDSGVRLAELRFGALSVEALGLLSAGSNGEMLWTIAGLAALAIAFVATRFMDQA